MMLFRRMAFLSAVVAMATTSAVAQSTDPSFNLINRSGQTIMEAYASASTDTSWGADRLGRDVVPNGRSYPIRLPNGQCVNDIRVVYQDRRAEERRNINTCAITDVEFTGQTAAATPNRPGTAAPLPQAGGQGNPSFHLVNNTGRAIREAYASLTTDTTWGEDRLGADMVAAGTHFAIRLPQGPCQYDVRIVLDNNEAIERRNVNLCDVITMAFP